MRRRVLAIALTVPALVLAMLLGSAGAAQADLSTVVGTKNDCAGSPIYQSSFVIRDVDIVMSRAGDWLNASPKIPYSQCKTYKGRPERKYRTDCSGFVSMAWGLDQSYSTAEFNDSNPSERDWYRHAKSNGAIYLAIVRKGDAIVWRHPDYENHIVLVESATTSSVTVIEMTSAGSGTVRRHTYTKAQLVARNATTLRLRTL